MSVMATEALGANVDVASYGTLRRLFADDAQAQVIA